MVALRHTSVWGYHTDEQPPKHQRPSGTGKCYWKSDDLNAKNAVRTKTGLEKIQGWVGHLFSGIGLQRYPTLSLSISQAGFTSTRRTPLHLFRQNLTQYDYSGSAFGSLSVRMLLVHQQPSGTLWQTTFSCTMQFNHFEAKVYLHKI